MKDLRELVENPNPEALKLSLMDCHIPGMMSLVLDGKPGKLTRVFLARRGIKPGELALHSHRYSLEIQALTQGVWQQLAHPDPQHGDYVADKFVYETPIMGRGGMEPAGKESLFLVSNPMPINSYINMEPLDVHTMWCDPGSAWCVRELGYGDHTHRTTVYGKLFSTDGLYQEASDEEIAEGLAERREILG